MAQLSHEHEDLSLILHNPCKMLGMVVVCIYNPGTGEAETGGFPGGLTG